MAGIILNLASLKAKADAAGIGTTATSTTPNLCPLKSNIASYVTNGSTTVIISGTWANNQLVEAASVSVNKGISSTQTLYRNVNVGTQLGGWDIPAGGGDSYVYKTVTYEYATKTNYTNGTSEIGPYVSGGYTVYGSNVHANTLGTTLKERTPIGVSSATETVAGTSVSVSGTIYQERNTETYHETLYSNHSLGNSTAGDIPAGGGSSPAYAYVSYKYLIRTWFRSGAFSDGTKNNGGSYIYGTSIDGDDLGTTMKIRTSTGKTSTPSGYAGGQYFTGTAVEIWQAANYITSIEALASSGYSTHVTYGNMSASGGTVTPSLWGRCKYTFKSGSTDTNSLTNPFSGVTATYSRTYSEYSDSSNAFTVNTSSGAVTAGANSSTTNTRSVTVSTTLTVSVSYSSTFSSLSTPTSSSITHYPTCTLNKKDGPAITSEGLWFTGTNPLPDIPATGGKNDIPTITKCVWKTNYDNGTSSETNVSTSSVSWYYAKYAKNSTYYDSSHAPSYLTPSYGGVGVTSAGLFDLGSNTGDRYLKGWTYIMGTYNNSTDYIRREVYQAGGSESYSISGTFSVANIPYYGGYADKPVLSGLVLTHVVNGAVTTSSLSLSSCTILGYYNSSSSTWPEDNQYTSNGYASAYMGFNNSTQEQNGNYIFMKITYTPSGYQTISQRWRVRLKQNANPGSGFTLVVNNPANASIGNPVVHLCDGNGNIKFSTGNYQALQFIVHSTWTNGYTGAIQKFFITMTSNHEDLYKKYRWLRISGRTETGNSTTLREKINIRNYFDGNTDNTSSYISMSNSFNASDYDSGNWAELIFSFTEN